MKIISVPALLLSLSMLPMMSLIGCGGGGPKTGLGGASGVGAAGGQSGSGAGGANAGGSSGGCDPSTSLLQNGSFESPVDPAGTYVRFNSGATFDGWTVVGPGNVVSLSTTYTQNGIAFPAQDCAQSIDLTGLNANSTGGISQSVTTVPGAVYDVSFWVGNVVDPSGVFGNTSTVNVLVDGTQVFSAVNADGAGTAAVSWKTFATSFVAASTSTTIEFHNSDPASDNSNSIDHVVLLAR